MLLKDSLAIRSKTKAKGLASCYLEKQAAVLKEN
jgi:hypothetical protein